MDGQEITLDAKQTEYTVVQAYLARVIPRGKDVQTNKYKYIEDPKGSGLFVYKT